MFSREGTSVGLPAYPLLWFPKIWVLLGAVTQSSPVPTPLLSGQAGEPDFRQTNSCFSFRFDDQAWISDFSVCYY